MPDIIDVSDTILRSVQRTRLFSDSSDISDAVVRVIELREANKVRIISQTVNITETLQAYKNDQELLPPPPIPETPNLIGTRERRIRVPRRVPRAILIEADLNNLAIAPLKVLAFRYEQNKAIAAIRPRPSLNVAQAPLMLPELESHKAIARSAIKTQLQPMTIKSRLALLSSPLIGLGEARLKTRPEPQTAESLKAVNFNSMYKLARLTKIILTLDNL